MNISVRFTDDFIQAAKNYAESNNRSVKEQIEYWAKIGRTIENNPELTFDFVRDSLAATTELEQNCVTRYSRRTPKD